VSLRARLTLAAALAGAIAVLVGSTVAFLVLRHDLVGSVDKTLRGPVGDLSRLARSGELGRTDESSEELGRIAAIAQVIDARGRILTRTAGAIPVTTRARQVAAQTTGSTVGDVRSGGVNRRVLTVALGDGTALQIARPLDEVERNIRRLAAVFGLVTGGGMALALGIGWLVSSAALAPLDRLTDSVERVAETTDLSHRIDDTGRRDELGRLARSFNRLLGALGDSRDLQRRLVVDASHELRTPLTSLRTNIEVLQRADELSPDERESLRQDVLAQMTELTALIGDVVELARGDAPELVRETILLDELVATVVARSELHARARGVSFSLALSPSSVRVVPGRLERAVANVLDNAVKWSPPDGVVQVDCHDGIVTIRDHGPGIPADDLPHVFDRFYRAAAARGLPGSGLGLAIVREVVESDGGTVTAANQPGGGAAFEIRLPTSPASHNGGSS